MGVRDSGPGGLQTPSPLPKKNRSSSVFWVVTKIWEEGVFGVSNMALIHIEREHANFVLENEMERIIDIFGSRAGMQRQLFILVWLNSYRRDHQLVELVFLVACHCIIYVCNLTLICGKINWWIDWWFLFSCRAYYLVYRPIHKSYWYCFPDLNLTSPS